jgi:hypothetical protein
MALKIPSMKDVERRKIQAALEAWGWEYHPENCRGCQSASWWEALWDTQMESWLDLKWNLRLVAMLDFQYD